MMLDALCCWTSLIQETVDEYNNSVHSVTRYTPSVLMKGIEEIPVSPVKETFDMEKAIREANENSDEYHKRNKKYVDSRRRDHDFKEGDKVYAKITSKLNRQKLAELHPGPYTIIKKNSDSIFELDTNRKKRANNRFHKNAHIPCIETQRSLEQLDDCARAMPT